MNPEVLDMVLDQAPVLAYYPITTPRPSDLTEATMPWFGTLS